MAWAIPSVGKERNKNSVAEIQNFKSTPCEKNLGSSRPIRRQYFGPWTNQEPRFPPRLSASYEEENIQPNGITRQRPTPGLNQGSL